MSIEAKPTYQPDQIVTSLPIILSELPPLEILGWRLRGKRYETIPVGLINMTVKIVDQTHVNDLATSIFGSSENKPGMGQIAPIITAAFIGNEGPDNIIYEPTDGFHRIETFIQRKSPYIEAIVLYGISQEEMYDLRILAANSFRATSFARIAE